MRHERAKGISMRALVAIFAISLAATIIISASLTAYVFKGKIALARGYEKIEAAIEQGPSALENPGVLVEFAKSSQDIVDILVLDKDNKILYSARNSFASKNKTLDLKAIEGGGLYGEGMAPYFMEDEKIPSASFLILEGFPSYKSMIMGWQAKNLYDRRHFFEPGQKSAYSLSYIRDYKNQEKVCFFLDIKPVKYAELYFKALSCVFLFYFTAYWILAAALVYSDASKSKLSGPLWGVFTLCCNLVGATAYLIYKNSLASCPECGASQAKGNDYCEACGSELSVRCPRCGQKLFKLREHCPSCGEKLKI